jgi:phosphoenolpyruvate carboxylase
MWCSDIIRLPASLHPQYAPAVSQRQDIQFPSKDTALRDDVHALGGLVGEVLRDQGGERLLAKVEQDRIAAIRRREGEPAAAVELVAGASDRAPAEARDLIRAFSTWFQVVNLAEKVHRIRRRRTYQSRSDRPQPGGIGDCLFRLKAAGLDAQRVLELFGQVTIYPVFRAHPTESTRRTILRNQQRIADLMIERLNPSLTPGERRSVMERIRFEVTAGWQTEEHPRERLTVADEREHVLFYLAEVIYKIVPALYEEIEVWLEHVYGLAPGSFELPCVVRFGSWVGGDMDGHPDVHAKTIRETLHRQQRVIISAYYEECLALAGKLSQSASRVGVSKALEQRIAEYSVILPAAHAMTPSRHDRMPYRVFLAQVAERLRTTYDGRPNGYETTGHFVADIETVAGSLDANGGRLAGLFLVKRLLRRARTFGFHLATLDVRQHADVHHDVVAQGLGDADWSGRPRTERARVLAQAVASDLGPSGALDAVGRRSLAVFQAMNHCRSRYGMAAVGDYIVADTRGADDVLAVLLLARWADATDRLTGQVPLDVVPSFEAITALEHAGDILGQVCDEPAYRAHLEARGNRQTALVGYAESNKECGIAASRYAVYQAQAALVGAAMHTRVGLSIVHGRGGTASRGGGPIEGLVLSAPPGAVNGCLRATEQGEVVNNSYGLNSIAMRTLEQAVHAVMLASADHRDSQAGIDRYLEVMAALARSSRQRYRALVHEQPRFMDYFHCVTPIDVIERMQVGSRPVYRPGQTGLDALRPTPWVFAWTQSRHTIPGWFGIGTGLEDAARELGPGRLTQAWSNWPYFSRFLGDVEMQLVRADLGIAALYDELAPDELRPLAEEIRKEHATACRWLTWIKGEVDLLDDQPRMQRSITLRSPYLDPMHYMQVNLLRRWRAGDRADTALFQALLASISGIAQGLQVTG